MLTESEMVKEIMGHRKALLAYILTIVRDWHLAEDILQEVCLVLARRRTSFAEIPDFWRLARGIAKRQSWSALRRHRKEAPLSPEVMASLEAQFDQVQSDVGRIETALLGCLQRLPESWRTIVHLRYWAASSVQTIAAKMGKTANSVSVTMNRIKSSLADCVRDAGEPAEEMAP